MKTSYSRILYGLLAIIVFMGCTGMPSRNQAPLTPVTLQQFWTHSTLFAGFYAADQNGYYVEQGLAVNLMEANVDSDRRQERPACFG